LEEDYRLEGISGDDLIGKEIKCSDLQFRYKGKWRSLDGIKVIDFQIRKNLSFDLVLGQDWLWMRKAKISFGFSLENCKCYAKIEIDDMSIPLIEEDSKSTGDSSSHKASSTKNNLSIAEQAVLRFSKSWDFVSKSTESESGLAQMEVINIINKISSNTEDRLEGSLFYNNKQRKKCHGIFHNKSETETDSSSSDSESTDSDWYNLDPIKP
ncbi:27731_t:CDS:2, partial [Dentiscutata erythropus]